MLVRSKSQNVTFQSFTGAIINKDIHFANASMNVLILSFQSNTVLEDKNY